MDTKQKFINSLGLVAKSKKFIYGEKLIENLDKVFLVISSCDISDNSLKRIVNKTTTANVKFRKSRLTSTELEKITKIKNIKAIGLTDKNQIILIEKNDFFE